MTNKLNRKTEDRNSEILGKPQKSFFLVVGPLKGEKAGPLP